MSSKRQRILGPTNIVYRNESRQARTIGNFGKFSPLLLTIRIKMILFILKLCAQKTK